MKKRISIPLTLCLIGGAVALIGELMGAMNKQKSDTISEQFGNAPDWLKHFISFLLGAICSHLWKWTYGGHDNVTVEGDLNITQPAEDCA